MEWQDVPSALSAEAGLSGARFCGLQYDPRPGGTGTGIASPGPPA